MEPVTCTEADLISVIRARSYSQVISIAKEVNHNSLDVYLAARELLTISTEENSRPLRVFRLLMLAPSVDLSKNYLLLIAMHLDVLSTQLDAKIGEVIFRTYKFLRLRSPGIHVSSVNHLDSSLLTNVNSVCDPEWMMKRGYYPVFKGPLRSHLRHALGMYISGYSNREIAFWAPHASPVINSLDHYPVWRYRSTVDAMYRACKNVCSLRLLYTPELLYSSKRPRAAMTEYCTKTVTTQELDNGLYIPVIRYGTSPDQGPYFSGSNTGYLGTFYYYEPESDVFLKYKKGCSYFNKTAALAALRKLPMDNTLAASHADGKLSRDLIYAPRYFGGNGDIPRYAGQRIGLYAAEDDLDQELAKEVIASGYDIVILEAMAGSCQIVTEVLDVRPRAESYNNLYRRV